jgi:hypothetical protein
LIPTGFLFTILSRNKESAKYRWCHGTGALCVPGRYEHTVRYYGYYSNKSRGMRKKADADDHISTIAPNELSPKQFAQNWARLIRKIYEVDPLVCPQCQGNMRIIAFIEDATLIQVILKHLGLTKSKFLSIIYLSSA